MYDNQTPYDNSKKNSKPKTNQIEELANKEKFDDLALQFQRSFPGSHEANQKYTRFRDEIGIGKYGDINPRNNPDKPLYKDEYHQILEDSKQDTELRLVSFLRKDFEISSLFCLILLNINCLAGILVIEQYLSLKRCKKYSKSIFSPEKGNIKHFVHKTIKHRHNDNVADYSGSRSYTENKVKKYVSEFSANQKIGNNLDSNDCNKEIQDKFAQYDSITYHSPTEREELIQLILEDPDRIFSSIKMNNRTDLNLQKIALLKLQYGYTQEEIAHEFGVHQSSISRLFGQLAKNPLLARIKQLLDLD